MGLIPHNSGYIPQNVGGITIETHDIHDIHRHCRIFRHGDDLTIQGGETLDPPTGSSCRT